MTNELGASRDALTERIRLLRSALPTLAAELAQARREAAGLRRENVALRHRIETLEGQKLMLPPSLHLATHGKR